MEASVGADDAAPETPRPLCAGWVITQGPRDASPVPPLN